MPFDDLLTDTISVLKQDGEIIENIKCSVQTDKIYINRSDILIKPNDLVQRKISNGDTETYKIIDPGFHEKFHSIPAGYQMHVKKLGLPEAENAVQNITYNISGTNNRINQNSTDNSTNISNINTDIQEHIKALREEIKKAGLSNDEATSSYEVINAIETQFESQTPSKTVIKTLLSALPNLGSIATIGSFIISCL